MRTAATGDEGASLACGGAFHVHPVVLDLMLPGRSRARHPSADMRQRRIDTPVLLLTARRHSSTIASTSLNGGADDYLVKPFAFPERAGAAACACCCGADVRVKGTRIGLTSRLWISNLMLIARRASRGDTVLDLAPREFELLAVSDEPCRRGSVARDAGPRRRQQLHRGMPLDNVIDVHMARLRRKVRS